MDINIDISKVLVLYFTIINKRILKYNDIKIIKKTDKAMEQCFGIKKNEENIWIYFNNIIVWNIIKAIGYQSNNINYGLYAFNKEIDFINNLFITRDINMINNYHPSKIGIDCIYKYINIVTKIDYNINDCDNNMNNCTLPSSNGTYKIILLNHL